MILSPPGALTDRDHEMLLRRWITPELADRAGLFRVTSIEGSQFIGRNGSGDYAGIAIPYTRAGNAVRDYQLRLDHPELELKTDGTMKERAKYLFPPGRSNILYFPPGATSEMLSEATLPMIITEGVWKALALWRLATEGQEQPRFLPIAVSGVWNWRGAIGREAGPDGSRQTVKGPIPDLDHIAWEGRVVYILFDSDKARNDSVLIAERELGRELKSRGAAVKTVNLPDIKDIAKTGADDYLAHPDGGPERLLALIDTAVEFEGDGIVLDPADPLPNARKFIRRFYTQTGLTTLGYYGNQFFGYKSGSYREVEESKIRAELYAWLETAKMQMRMKGGKIVFVAFKPNVVKVSNIIDAVRAVTNLPAEYAPPCWLDENPSHIDPMEVVSCSNGLLHIPSRTLIPATPRFFTLNNLNFPYDPNTPEPKQWFHFLDQLWHGDAESRETLQEFVGYLLTPDTRYQKILMLIGPKRAGKGTIARIIRRLLGDRNVCTPTLAGLAENFGLSVLIGKAVAIIADARISGRADTAVITERLLSISGEDAQTIPRKYLPDWNGNLSSRFIVMTNELPKIEDASGTLASRFIVLALHESFYGREDSGLLGRLIPELPGIFLWALDGWDRLRSRGRFIQPASSMELIGQFEDLGSPIGAFIRDRCDVGPGYEVKPEHLFEDWKSWCAENGREHPGTAQVFGRNLQSIVLGLKVIRPRVMGVQVRYYTGIRLKAGFETR